MQLGNPLRAPGDPNQTAPNDTAGISNELPQPIYQYIAIYPYTCSDCRGTIPARHLVTIHGAYTVPDTRRVQCADCVNATGGGRR